MQGVIKNLNEKGFGFISVEGQEKDLFFHSTDCSDNNFKDLNQGDEVSFETEESEKGLKAVNVVLVS